MSAPLFRVGAFASQEPAVPITYGGTLTTNGSNDLVCTPTDASLTGADYRVYDFRRNGESILLLNCHFKTSGGTANDTVKNYTSYSTTTTIPAGMVSNMGNGPDDLGAIHTNQSAARDIEFEVATSNFSNNRWTIAAQMRIIEGVSSPGFTVNQQAAQISGNAGGNNGTRGWKFKNAGGDLPTPSMSAGGAATVTKDYSWASPDQAWHEYVATWTNATASSANALAMRFDGSNMSDTGSTDSGNPGAVAGTTKTVKLDFENNTGIRRFRWSRVIVAPYTPNIVERDLMTADSTTNWFVHNGSLTNILGSGGTSDFHCVITPITGNVAGTPMITPTLSYTAT